MTYFYLICSRFCNKLTSKHFLKLDQQNWSVEKVACCKIIPIMFKQTFLLQLEDTSRSLWIMSIPILPSPLDTFIFILWLSHFLQLNLSFWYDNKLSSSGTFSLALFHAHSPLKHRHTHNSLTPTQNCTHILKHTEYLSLTQIQTQTLTKTHDHQSTTMLKLVRENLYPYPSTITHAPMHAHMHARTHVHTHLHTLTHSFSLHNSHICHYFLSPILTGRLRLSHPLLQSDTTLAKISHLVQRPFQKTPLIFCQGPV